MNDLLAATENFYHAHADILITACATALFTLTIVYFQKIVSAGKDFLLWFGKKIGGDLAVAAQVKSYLNWIVVENQDLKLTGVIGSGPKPKLERVFISLALAGEPEVVLEENPRDPHGLARLWGKLGRLFRARGKPQSAIDVSGRVTFYKPPTLSTLASLLNRNVEYIALLFIACFWLAIMVVPLYCIFFIGTPLASLLGTAVYFFVLILTAFVSFSELRSDSIPLSAFYLSLSVASVLIVSLLRQRMGARPEQSLPTVVGIVVGALAFLLLRTGYVGRQYAHASRAPNQIGGVLNKYDNVAILGEAGSGKSTLMQFLALTFAREKAGERKFRRKGIVGETIGIRQWYFPVLIELRTVAKFLTDRGEGNKTNTLVDAWRECVLPADIRSEFPTKHLQRMMRKGQCLFLFDGLDEVTSDEEFKAVVREIKGFVSTYARNKFIVTSRFSGWRGGLGSGFQELRIENLNKEQIEDFIDDWYRAIEENQLPSPASETSSERQRRLRKAADKAARLKQAFRDVKSLRALAENPLLLSIICFVNYYKTLPGERVRLYQDCSDLLLEQWDREKGLYVDDTDLSPGHKEAIMQEIAFRLHTGAIGSELQRKEASGKQIVSVIEEKLRQFHHADQNAVALFRKLIDRSGLIVRVESYTDQYAFSHLTFQEFYTAKYMFENGVDLFDYLSAQSSERLRSWWREVILVYVCLSAESSQLIKRICSENDVRLEDPALTRLQIAAECLNHAIKTCDPEFEEMILQFLFNVRTDTTTCIVGSNPELRDYLLLFAEDPNFCDRAVQFSLKRLSLNSDSSSLATRLIDLLDSSDSATVAAALQSLAGSALIAEVPVEVLEDKLVALLHHTSDDVQLATIEVLVRSTGLLARSRLIKETVRALFLLDDAEGSLQSARATRAGSRFALMSAKLRLLGRLSFACSGSKSDSRWLIDSLWSAFGTRWARARRTMQSRSYEFQQMMELLPGIAGCVVALSDTPDAEIYLSQLSQMLYGGDSNEGIMALRTLAWLHRETGIERSELFNAIMSSLKNMFSSVRREAVDQIPDLELTVDQRTRIIGLLGSALRPKSIKERLAAGVRNSLVGTGCLGITRQERHAAVNTIGQLFNQPRQGEMKLQLDWLDHGDIFEAFTILRYLTPSSGYEPVPEIINQFSALYVKHNKNTPDEDYLKTTYDHSLLDGRHTIYWPKATFLQGLSDLAVRVDQPDCKRVVARLVAELKARVTSEYDRLELSWQLIALGVDSEESAANRQFIIDSLRNRNWYVADKAFEIAWEHGLFNSSSGGDSG